MNSIYTEMKNRYITQIHPDLLLAIVSFTRPFSFPISLLMHLSCPAWLILRWTFPFERKCRDASLTMRSHSSLLRVDDAALLILANGVAVFSSIYHSDVSFHLRSLSFFLSVMQPRFLIIRNHSPSGQEKLLGFLQPGCPLSSLILCNKSQFFQIGISGNQIVLFVKVFGLCSMESRKQERDWVGLMLSETPSVFA